MSFLARSKWFRCLGFRPSAGKRSLRARRSETLHLESLEVRAVPSFVAPRNYESVSQVAVGDINGDGRPDLVTGMYYSDNLSIWLGNGDGTFQAPQPIPLGFTPVALVTGDFNSDGHLDIAATDFNDNAVGILLGNGDGSFRSVQTLPAGNRPEDMAAGYFHGHGILDLAILTDSGVNIVLGNGDGTFRAPVYYAVSTGPVHSLAVADLNGDGNPDIVVGAFQGVDILYGNGDGTFRAPVYVATGSGYTTHVAVGDLNGDHAPDLVATNDNGVNVLLGNGDGTFHAPVQYAAPLARAAGLADLTGNGILDIVVGRIGNPAQGDPGGISVLMGNGDGTFQPAQNENLGPVYTMTLADFNGDNIPDLAFTTGGFIVGIRLGNSDGTFQAAPTYATGSKPVAEAVGDFNGDGNADLAVVNQGDNTVSILLGNGDGTFQTAVSYAVGSHPDAIVVGDFNGDGIFDLAAANLGDNSVSILYGNGDGTFQTAVSIPVGSQPVALAAGDLNGDGFCDLVVANSGSSSVSILISNGDGTFQPAQSLSVRPGPKSVALADVNGDGSLDLLVGTRGAPPRQPGGVGVFLGNGDGTFQGPGTYYTNGGGLPIAVGDLNGDGIPDFVTGDTVWLGNGDGTFRPGATLPTLGTVGSNNFEVLADVNGDGILDLVAGSVDGVFQPNGPYPYISGSVKVLLGNGDGTFQANSFAYATGQGYGFVAVGDFNNDGFPDLVVANTVENSVSILLNTADGTGPAPSRHGPAHSAVPRAAAAAPVLTASDLARPAALPAPRSVPTPDPTAARELWAAVASERDAAVWSAVGQPSAPGYDVGQPAHHRAVDEVFSLAWIEDLSLDATVRT